jgi:hypothetical protein
LEPSLNDEASLHSHECETVDNAAEKTKLSASCDEALINHLPTTESLFGTRAIVESTSENNQPISSEDSALESASGVSSQEPCSLLSNCDVERIETLSSTKLNHSFVTGDKAIVSSLTPPPVKSSETSPQSSSDDVVDMESTRSPHQPPLLKAEMPSISSPVQSPSPLPQLTSPLLNHDRLETPVETILISQTTTNVKVKCEVEEALINAKGDYFAGKLHFNFIKYFAL